MSPNWNTKVLVGAAFGACAVVQLAVAGAGVSSVTGTMAISERPSDQPILVVLPRDRGRSVLLNADPSPGGVDTIVGGSGMADWSAGSALPYGAPMSEADRLIFVRTREPLPPIAISPWATLTEEHIDELLRTRPWIRRGDEILEDMKLAQQQWLRENGYIAQPRSIVGQDDGVEQAPATPPRVGSGVTILSPNAPGAAEAAKEASKHPTPEKVGLKPESIIRVSRPAATPQ